MARELKDIELSEVSLVDKAANKKKFLFFKQEGKKPSKKLKKKINIVIDSDGTIGGTKIAVNKEDIENLRDFSFSFWSNEDMGRAVSCSYSKVVETDDGFSRSETFYLSKGDAQMNKEIKEQLEKYFEGQDEIDFEKAAESDVIIKSLATVLEYQAEFPDDLKKAVGIVAKQAGFCDTVITKMLEKKAANDDGKKADIEKAGAKLSKDTLKKITDALAALKAILPAMKENTEKSDQSEVEKSIAALTKQIEGIEKKKDDGTKDKLTKILKELTDRLAVVEKGTGVKKSVEGQDDDDDDNTDKKWPSFSG